jgi:hypothetical protein
MCRWMGWLGEEVLIDEYLRGPIARKPASSRQRLQETGDLDAP